MNTIPLARISVDDERPSGLKLDRFRKENGSFGKGLFDRDLSFSSKREVSNAASDGENRERPSLSSASGTMRFALSPPPTTTSFSNKRNSPSIPARSPFRIRDSEASMVSIDRSGSLSRPAPTPAKVSDPRASLMTDAVAHLWKSGLLTETQFAQRNEAGIHAESMDDVLAHLTASQAIIDASKYKSLPLEEIEKMREEHKALQEQISRLHTQLTIERRIKAVRQSLAQLETVSGEQQLATKQATTEASWKTENLADDLMKLMEKSSEIERKLLEHTAGALREAMLWMEKRVQSDSRQQKQQQQSMPPTTTTTITMINESQQLEWIKRAKDIIQRYHLESNERDDQSIADSAYSSSTGVSVDVDNDGSTLVHMLEKEMDAYRSRLQQLERQIESIEELRRLDMLSIKKHEVQLQAMQDKYEASEAKCKKLEQKMNEKSRNPLDEELARLNASLNSLSSGAEKAEGCRECEELKQEIRRLEEQLEDSKDRARYAEEQVAQKQKLVDELRETVTQLELQCSKAEAEINATAAKSGTAEEEIQKYQQEILELRSEKQRWERVLKRDSVIQMVEGGSEAYKAKYEQLMEEQRQEFEAQLQEQQALLQKTLRTQKDLETDRDKMASICKDLEDLVRDKSKTLDARDLRINELEKQLAEVRQEQQQQKQESGRRFGNQRDAEILREAQAAFTAREEAWMAQIANMETNFEGILKEFDRLTGAAMEFETDRMKYEQRIDQLTRDVQDLDAKLTEERINKLGHGDKEGPTTASLRREFRQLMNDTKLEHQREMDREIQERKQLESRLKDLKHELETSRYGRVNKGVQTNFIA